MMLLISVIYIAIHAICAWRRLEPVLQAIGDGREMPVRVSVAFCIGTLVAAVAWGYVLSVMLEVSYV